MKFFNRKKKPPRYRLYDSWEPDFDTELKLAVDSFYNDAAYHRAFGVDGKQLDKSAITALMIGFIVRRLQNPMRYMVTVRRNRELIAMLSGSLSGTMASVPDFSAALDSSDIRIKMQPAITANTAESIYAKKIKKHAAEKNEALEEKSRVYMELIENHYMQEKSSIIYFSIGMIAVAAGEQRQGHLKAMLDRLAVILSDSKPVKYIRLNTYDQEKVNLYKGLGFDLNETLETDGMIAWNMSLPLQ